MLNDQWLFFYHSYSSFSKGKFQIFKNNQYVHMNEGYNSFVLITKRSKGRQWFREFFKSFRITQT